MTANRPSPSRKAVVLVLGLVAVALLRVIDTYHVFSQTIDEPAHVGPGMQWLDQGRYDYDSQHPPLARVASAIGIYLTGTGSSNKPWFWDEGNEILHANGAYWRNLTLARVGILPFFVLGIVVLFIWTRRLYDDQTALVAVVLFTTLPPVLAHAGLATTDVPLTATLLLSIYVLVLWVEKPDVPRSILLGASVAVTVLSKFSAIVFFPACAAVIFALKRRSETELPDSRGTPVKGRIKIAMLIVMTLFVVLWAGYRFSVGSVSDAGNRPHESLDRIFGARGTPHDVAYAAAEAPVYPMPDFFRGINFLRKHNADGHKGQYLFGEVSQSSWWYFFFVVLLVKTPIPFLVLAGIGCAVAVRGWKADRDWLPLVPPACAIVIFAACMPSRIKLGVRHIIQIYPLLAVAAAAGTVALWRSSRHKIAARSLVVTLFAWQIAASAYAHPDYLPYFNELAGRHPERILGDSDLDWGQDLERAIGKLREMGAREAAVAISTSAEVTRFGPPNLEVLRPHQRRGGWIAVSLFRLRYDHGKPPYDGYAWLEAYTPVARAGKTIRIYNIPDLPDVGRSGPIRPDRRRASASSNSGPRQASSRP